MEKILVIGGSGFLGSHTADELSRRGFEVTIFDRIESPWLRAEQSMHVGELLDLESVEKAMAGADAVYHFAGISDINDAGGRPFETINLNVLGTTGIVDLAVKLQVKRFIFASSMYVYSSYGSFYRASKQAAETIIEAYNEQYGIEYTILRYGSLYGPRAQDWNGLTSYVKQILASGRLEYDGTGRERREYIHVLDAARLSVDILDHSHKNRAITVTGAQTLSSTELIEMIFEIAGIQTNVKYEEGERHKYHYGMTPYRYTPKQATKLVPDEFIDLGQGILEIVEEVHKARDNSR